MHGKDRDIDARKPVCWRLVCTRAVSGPLWCGESQYLRADLQGLQMSHQCWQRGPRCHRVLGHQLAKNDLRQNPHTVTSNCNRVMVHRVVILFTAMTGPQPSARATADPRTVRLALELLERTAGRRRRCRRCRSVIAENARKRGQAWSVCTPCAQAIEDDARQLVIAPALLRRCLVCRADIAHLRAGARTCTDACRNVLSRNLRRRRRPVL